MAPSQPGLTATFSAGLTGYCDSERLDVCIERADKALYKAKRDGRNRTVIQASPVDAQDSQAAKEVLPQPSASDTVS